MIFSDGSRLVGEWGNISLVPRWSHRGSGVDGEWAIIEEINRNPYLNRERSLIIIALKPITYDSTKSHLDDLSSTGEAVKTHTGYYRD
jgi:hypothetical protein